MCSTDIKQQPSLHLLSPGNPSAPRVFPVSIGNLVGPPNFDFGLSTPRPFLSSSSFSSLFPQVLFLFVSMLLRHFFSSVFRLFRENNSIVSVRRYRYIFHDMKIRSTIVHHAKDPPMKQMRVIVRKYDILYYNNIYCIMYCTSMQCVHILIFYPI